MKKYIIPLGLGAIAAIALYLTSKAQKLTKNSSTNSSTTNEPFSILRTTTTTTTAKTISESSGNNQQSTTNQEVVDTSQIYDYWQEKGEYIYLRKGGKTAIGNYAVGFLKDGRTVYTNYINEGTPEETMLYSLSPDYVLTY